MAAVDDAADRIDDRPDVELRFEVPRWIADVIDAHVAAGLMRRASRNKVCLAVMHKWAADQVHLGTMLSRLNRGNGNVTPSDWSDLGD